MKPFVTAVLVLFQLLMPVGVQAFTVNARDRIVVPVGEVVKGTLIAAGETIEIAGTVEGDLLCAARSVLVTGRLEGDLICAAQKISVPGLVVNDMRMAAQTVDVSGRVEGNLTALGQDVSFRDSSLSGELIALGQTVSFAGTLGDSALLRAQSVTISGNVGNGVDVMGESVNVTGAASISGSLIVSAKNSKISPSAYIGGEQVVRPFPEELGKKNNVNIRSPQTSPPQRQFLGTVVSLVIFAFFLRLVFPEVFKKTIQSLETKPFRSLGLGLLALIFLPGILIGLVLTLVGIPFALILAVLAYFAVYFSRIFPAVLLGKIILQVISPTRTGDDRLAVLLGIPVYYFVTRAVIIGPVISLAAVIFGLGAFLVSRERLPASGKRRS